MFKFLTELVIDIKTYISLLIVALQGFFGPTYVSIILIIILAHIDIAVGYYKNKKLLNEKFRLARVFTKLGQLGKFIIVLAASIVSDHFFKNNGLTAFWVANKVCDVFAIWQFLHIVENIGQIGDNPWLKVIKKILSRKITDVQDIVEETKEEIKKENKDEQTKQ